MPTVIPTNLTKDQEQAYLCKYFQIVYNVFTTVEVIRSYYVIYLNNTFS